MKSFKRRSAVDTRGLIHTVDTAKKGIITWTMRGV